jgi:hypothetical protein
VDKKEEKNKIGTNNTAGHVRTRQGQGQGRARVEPALPALPEHFDEVEVLYGGQTPLRPQQRLGAVGGRVGELSPAHGLQGVAAVHTAGCAPLGRSTAPSQLQPTDVYLDF